MRRHRTNWKKLGRRTAACALGGSAALASATSYAQTAFDNASDPVYADGWQAGDNGGFGFTPWNFDATYVFQGTSFPYAHPGFKAIDDGLQNGTQFSNPFNNIGRAWAMGATPTDDGSNHVGRGFPALQVGQTLKVVFDNPTKRQFFKGYFIRLNGGTGGVNGNIANLGYAASFPLGTPVPKMAFGTFEYFTYGQWFLQDAASGGNTNIFDTDTANAGARLQVTRTGADSYSLLVDSFGPGADFSAISRTFDHSGAPVDWIEFV